MSIEIDDILELGNDVLNSQFEIESNLSKIFYMRISSIKEKNNFLFLRVRVDIKNKILKEALALKVLDELTVNFLNNNLKISYSKLVVKNIFFDNLAYDDCSPLHINIKFNWHNRKIEY